MGFMMSREAQELREIGKLMLELGRAHPSWSMVHGIISNAVNHIEALARVIETRDDVRAERRAEDRAAQGRAH